MAAQAPVISNGVASGPIPELLGAPLEVLLAAVRNGNGYLAVTDATEAQPPFHGDDVRVIHVTAAEAGSQLPYAVLADVLRPILHLLHTIPEPQVDALRSAFALASPGSGERLALCAGTLSLLVAAAPVGNGINAGTHFDLSVDGVAQTSRVDIDNAPGAWLKRNLYNFPEGLPAGSHTFVGVFYFDGALAGTVTVTIIFT